MKKLIIMVFAIALIITGCSGKVKKDENQKQEDVKANAASQKTNSNLPKFTLEELSRYDGSNGKVYVGYAGKVYDVSNVYGFTNGKPADGHKVLYGKDLTDTMYLSPHGAGVVRAGKEVGVLVK